MKNILYLTLILSLFAIISCSIDESTIEPGDSYILVLDFEIELDIAEPSGLTYDPTTHYGQ